MYFIIDFIFCPQPDATIEIGNIGVFGILFFFFLCFLVIELGWTPEQIVTWWQKLKNKENEPTEETSPADLESNIGSFW